MKVKTLMCRATLLVVAFATFSNPADAPGAEWSIRQPPTQAPNGYTAEEYFASVACPATNACLATGEPNLVSSSARPEGDAGAWQTVQPREAVPCEENPRHCEPPPELPPGFPKPLVVEPWQTRTTTDVSCPGASFCAITTRDGFVYTTHEPLGPASAWTVTDLDGDGPNTHLESISCPDPSFCVAVSAYRNTGGRVLASANPDGGAGAWHEADLSPEATGLDLRSVACPTRDLCFAGDQHGQIVRSTDPIGPPSAWQSLGTPGGSGGVSALECAGTVLCVAGNSGGNLLTTTDPGSSRPQWRELNGGGSVPVTDIDCIDPGHCLAVDNNGSTIASTDPTGGADAWARQTLIPYVEYDPEGFPIAPNAIFAVSCASPSLCVLGATERRVLVSTDPFAPPKSAVRKGKRRHLPKRPRTHLAHVDRVRTLAKAGKTKMTFRFFTRTRSRGFRCRHDNGLWRLCRSPHRYRLGLGRHVFAVRAIGPTGLLGPVAKDRFRVVDELKPCKPGHCNPNPNH